MIISKSYKISSWLNSFVALKYLPRFFALIYRSSPVLFITNLLLRLVKSVFPVLMLWIGKEIIDEIIILAQQEVDDYNRLFMLIGFEFGLAILSDLLNRSINLTEVLLGSLYNKASSVELIQKTSKVEISDLEDSEFYDKLERARRQTSNRVGLMTNVLSQVQDLITIVSLVTALIYFYPILVLLVAISIIPSFINELKFSKSNYAMQRRLTPERRQMDYMRMLGASDISAKEVKLFGLADFISRSFSTIADTFHEETKSLETKRTILGSLFHILSDIAYYGAYVFIIFKATAALITIGELTFLAGSFRRLRLNLSTIFSRFTRINENALYLKDYFDFIDLKLDEAVDFERRPLPKEIKEGFIFQHVSFRYPKNEHPVFSDLNLRISKGEKVALVGENGSGKTTLIKLLLRFYEPDTGAILLDGVDIRHYDKLEYQKMFGAIFQDFVKYYLPAKVNIAVGNIEDVENEAKIREAAELSLAHDVVKDLEGGYDQILGNRWRAGTELSGGQWQKIAIARAYMSDADIIILDEPTSALDARAEYEVFQRFMGLTKNKTSIIISHRFSTVRMADRIIVLSDGKILEHGSHQTLMNNNGLYAELFNLQAEGYK